MPDPFEIGLGVIRRAYAKPVIYTGAGLAGETISAIKSIEPADALTGYSGKGQRICFEIPFASLPGLPSKTDTIAEGGTSWQISDINRRDDISAHQLFVRRA